MTASQSTLADVPAEPADLVVRRILCAVGPSASSRPVIECAAWLATLFDADVRLFHAADWTADIDLEQLLDVVFAHTRRVPGRVRFSADVTTGRPAREISRHAQLTRADLLMIGIESVAVDRTHAALCRIAATSGRPVLAIAANGDGRAAAPPIQRLMYLDGTDDASRAAASYARILARKTAAPAIPVSPAAARASADSSCPSRVLVLGIETTGRTWQEIEGRVSGLDGTGQSSLLIVPSAEKRFVQ